ncbi:hypothetical protein QBC33DRAFT_518605 [Phialemonium atrogriseum]|uniref:Uncharacterized protein n=1 Tax=Phialemonium atrogriseum TaxID=1093897 RepID=A0AAJ0FDN7_9PEZI|nr:uncharacterized protein QBC33DRAFT_518605 [Phialemonium atrogriseum]KAK1763452.1 hypothetical protein QBC33DRAFT_518605 [Phialemonium atrogriseum]
MLSSFQPFEQQTAALPNYQNDLLTALSSYSASGRVENDTRGLSNNLAGPRRLSLQGHPSLTETTPPRYDSLFLNIENETTISQMQLKFLLSTACSTIEPSQSIYQKNFTSSRSVAGIVGHPQQVIVAVPRESMQQIALFSLQPPSGHTLDWGPIAIIRVQPQKGSQKGESFWGESVPADLESFLPRCGGLHFAAIAGPPAYLDGSILRVVESETTQKLRSPADRRYPCLVEQTHLPRFMATFDKVRPMG